ncbi:cryptochrome/photolyase family protein [Roseococcus suduntuyensis]|uniref:Deoxyribodipyrimidine photo-lyase n=1 Tax=Roseococcus suduntuyensis TaxID=455361 RepID=A0A840AH24_9PROT|nr:deoxyribodipyrimidine photo-lyase [Roseococcus suduntuyensis]MBB3899863.1 deoxyribodipyrimidine photo-lyase [Roseococcus suduntuyensis]
MTPALIWFRQDLRLDDNPALHAAQDRPLLACYILDDEAAAGWAHGGAQRWWLHHSLAALRDALASRGATLHLAVGRAEAVVPQLAAAIGASEVHAGRLYEPWARRRDEAVAKALQAEGRRLVLHSSSLLHEPHRVRTGQGKPYSVYTPFSRAIFALGEPPPPLPAPGKLHAPADAAEGVPLETLGLLPERDWWREFPRHWTPGEDGARSRLRRFAARALEGYDGARNTPGVEGTSGLSPHLRFGELSPRQVWHAAREAGAKGEATFLKEILWREFSYHLLWHRQELPEAPLQANFAQFPWQPDAKLLRAWQRGRTGYPIVDAGMRQLWRMGWMHNRVRMIAGSLLVKHLLQPWQAGAAWFWDTLLDGDLASNSASWQWVAGCGADAAPYFRVFNPTLQGEKFDADGAYVRHWVPELAKLPDKYLHKPWEAPDLVLRGAGVRLGADYPRPIVEHAAGRARALDAYAALRAEAAPA